MPDVARIMEIAVGGFWSFIGVWLLIAVMGNLLIKLTRVVLRYLVLALPWKTRVEPTHQVPPPKDSFSI